MKKVSKALVTGGAGFIGSHIVDELLKRGIETIVIDDLSTGHLVNLSHHHKNDLLHMIIGDVRNAQELLRNHEGIDVVFHEAAIASIPRSIKEPMTVHDANVNMTLELMNFCLRKNIEKFLFASTAAVYGVPKNIVSEKNICTPSSPYGASKLCVENYLNAYHQSYGLKTVALRYFNVYGPRQIVNDYSGVITTFINNILEWKTPTIHGDGTQVRDFIFVKDIVAANMLAMDSQAAVGQMFNIATGRSISIKELLEVLQDITNTKSLGHKFGPRREGDVKFGLVSTEKIKNGLGFEASTSLEKGLEHTFEFFKSQIRPSVLNI